MDLYRYCGNGPTDGTDPTGLFKRSFLWSGPLGNYSASVFVEKADLKSGDLLGRLAELITGDPSDKSAFPLAVRQTQFKVGDRIDVAPLLVSLQTKLGKNIVKAARTIVAQFPTNDTDSYETGNGPDGKGLDRAGVLAFWKPEKDWKKRPLCECGGAQMLAVTKGLIDTVGPELFDQLRYTNARTKKSYSYNTRYHDVGTITGYKSVDKLPVGVWGHFNILSAYGTGGPYSGGENVISEGNGKFWGFSGDGAHNAMYDEMTAEAWKAFLVGETNKRNGTNTQVADATEVKFYHHHFVGDMHFYDVGAIAMQLFDLRQAKATTGTQRK